MGRITATSLATLIMVPVCATVDCTPVLAAERNPSTRVRTTTLHVRAPTVIVFVPPSWGMAAKANEGEREMIAHIRFAVGDVNKCKGLARIAVRMVFADQLAVTLDGQRTVIDLAGKFPDSAGAYLFKPGKKPCAIATSDDTAFLGTKLSQAVGEFFEVSECLQEGWSSAVCPASAG
jgi:hypothetical protein